MSNPTAEALLAELQKLRAENTKLKERAAQKLTFRVSKAGCVSVYGLGRYPISLYRSQWAVLLQDKTVQGIKDFIVDNEEALNAAETANKAAKAEAVEAEQA